jgi:hypothetical protein
MARATLAIVGLFAVAASACGGAPREQRSPATSRLPPTVSRAIEVVRCYLPAKWDFGFVESYDTSACAHVVKAHRTGRYEWQLQLRMPPVYCIDLHLHRSMGDARLDVSGVGSIEQVACPASAYPRRRAPDLRLKLGDSSGHPTQTEGVVLLTAVDAKHTLVVVNADMDTAWISPGTCRVLNGLPLFRLEPFYSFRSETTILASLQTLVQTPHVLLVDRGGAHGGDPLGCVPIQRS